MPISNSKETIDERVLRLLGLEDVFDLDYDTYLTLLKEAMVKGRMPRTSIPTEEIELLTGEYKRVKTKTGRFSVKAKKISARNFSVGNSKAKISDKKQKALPGTAAISSSPIQKSFENSISTIASAVVSISETLKSQQKIDRDTAAYGRKQAEAQKRKLRETNLEKRFSGLKKAAEKIIAPVKSVLDRLIDFFVKIFLGRVVYKLIEWMGDPENQSKVKSIIRFIKDWWPSLIGSYILFGTTFGRFTRGILKTIGVFVYRIGRVAIPKLLSIIRRNPKAALAAGLFTAGATVPAMFPGTVDEQERKTGKSGGSTEDKIRALEQQKANLNLLQRMQGVGAEIDEQISFLKTGKTSSYGFNGGGLVRGLLNKLPRIGYSSGGRVSGRKGTDTIPAMLTDGEFVMSRGAVQMFGADNLAAMNAAGGGTNRPSIIRGTTYAQGGGLLGNDPGEGGLTTNTPFVKDPFGAISRFIKFKFGADVGKQSTWGIPTIPQRGSKPRVSSGSLITDPFGAAARIANNMGIRTSDVPAFTSSKQPSSRSGSNVFARVMDTVRSKTSGSGKSEAKTGEKGFFQELQEKLTGSGAATYRNAGNIYAKQMLGGFGGPISERDLAPESQKELQKAIQRAKKRTGSEIAKAEAKIAELRAMGAKDGNSSLETQKSFLKKLKAGGIRVQYTDYADEKGKMSASAENAKNILGQFWAYGRDKKEGGGYRIEDTYDFDPFKKKVKDPKTGKMVEMDLDAGELIRDVLLGKGKSTQQILQAAYLLNPLRGKGDVDMVLGGKRTAAESFGLTGSKTLLGGMLGISGKPKDKNTQALEAKRPWWDKMGWFGGASGQMERSKQYYGPAGGPAKIGSTKPSSPTIKPPSSGSTNVTVVKSSPNRGGQRSGSRPTNKTPNITSSNKSKQKMKILGFTLPF
jgi:hypothetical protein